ncbi:protein SODIUM POTASSIUM ROOT DEFECTIVE 2-like protein [Cinnamomum micranthum f. kanehirae]|uniref:Protein SODIUM POTASSIUM ROOT DEFECTIVE 2-like protein n=1 Tax=Cinnamomum micranthum f. kanehirae TaxID=337451 RepID=A0A443NG87_9MAGN|nr:protein SODIUM POTASSIUM ROOT DEFECTIVE 2-like protein [Cinnamomum micranthum f. kanehirae]
MGKLKLGRMLDCLCLSCSSSTCFCMNGLEGEDSMERKALIGSDGVEMMRIKDIIGGTGNQTLAYQLKPKMVVLRVSMHCNGCARKVEKHISRMDGVTSFEVDLESKKVIVIGDILPFEVLESVSKVKNAELWTSPIDVETTQHYPVDHIMNG